MFTRRLLLQPATAAHLIALIAGPDAFHEQFGLRVEPGYLEFPGALEYSIDRLGEGTRHARWWKPYLVRLRHRPILIGLAGFKGPPDSGGAVELGYGIAPAYRNRGYATEVVAGLVTLAFRRRGVAAVRAHTLAVPGPSPRVLEKCGFRQIAEAVDPEDGPVWLWKKEPA
jgi:RimJ/RimL family protein N-acetyltransferase